MEAETKNKAKDRDRIIELWRLYRAESPRPDHDVILSEDELREAQLERFNPYYSRRRHIEFVSR